MKKLLVPFKDGDMVRRAIQYWEPFDWVEMTTFDATMEICDWYQHNSTVSLELKSFENKCMYSISIMEFMKIFKANKSVDYNCIEKSTWGFKKKGNSYSLVLVK